MRESTVTRGALYWRAPQATRAVLPCLRLRLRHRQQSLWLLLLLLLRYGEAVLLDGLRGAGSSLPTSAQSCCERLRKTEIASA